MAVFFKQYTVTATAATLTSALGLSDAKGIRQLDVKAAVANAGSVFLGASNVTNVPANAGVALSPGQSYAIHDRPAALDAVSTDDVYIVGTAADIAYIAVVD